MPSASPVRLRLVQGLAAAVLLALGLAAAADARTAANAEDARPNILVVMTDDQTVADLDVMPNVRRLAASRGTSFADAVDSFPLCCPARATFLTGQYAHNHGVTGNFHPEGWYGWKDRANALPAWLRRSGYRTSFIGKWLNGYGAKTGRGEVPAGWDTWRGLLDVSAYDYYNFVMSVDGRSKTWGDADFARKLVTFGKIQTEQNPEPLIQAVLGRVQEVFGPPPYRSWGTENERDYSIDVTGGVTNDLVARERSSKKPFFVWWAPAGPHREDVAVTLLGRPGPDPRPPKRYAEKVKKLRLPRSPSFNQTDVSSSPTSMQQHLPSLTAAQITQLEADYQGRAGSLMAIDDQVKTIVATLRRTGQLDNTLIVFTSDNGWLQGEHRVPGDKFLPYEESLRVPFIIAGPGVPKGRTVRGQVANVDFAPTILDAANAKPGRTQDGVSLLPIARTPSRRPNRAIYLEAQRPLFSSLTMPNQWDQPYQGVRTDRWKYVRYATTGDEELYDLRADRNELRNLAGDPTRAPVKAELAAAMRRLAGCKGPACAVPVP